MFGISTAETVELENITVRNTSSGYHHILTYLFLRVLRFHADNCKDCLVDDGHSTRCFKDYVRMFPSDPLLLMGGMPNS